METHDATFHSNNLALHASGNEQLASCVALDSIALWAADPMVRSFRTAAGIMGAIATQIDMIRDVFSVHTLIRIESWTGSCFGIVSASFIFKAWWQLQNSGDKQYNMKDGALSAMVGMLLLLGALSFGVDMPFTG